MLSDILALILQQELFCIQLFLMFIDLSCMDIFFNFYNRIKIPLQLKGIIFKELHEVNLTFMIKLLISLISHEFLKKYKIYRKLIISKGCDWYAKTINDNYLYSTQMLTHINKLMKKKY